MACFLGGAPQPRVIASEGGHATLAATTAREEALIGYLRRKFGLVWGERVVCGDGRPGRGDAIRGGVVDATGGDLRGGKGPRGVT